MKKISKTVVGVIIGVLVAFTIDVAAEAVISSGAVSYSNASTSETTVSGALDELFSAVDINQKIGTTDISAIGDGTITGAIDAMNNDIHYKVRVESFISGTALNTDYEIPKPNDEELCMLISLAISNTSYSDPYNIDLDTLYDINYIGILKRNDLYQITNGNCLGKPARATYICWEE